MLLLSSSQPVLSSEHIWANGRNRWQEGKYMAWLLTEGVHVFQSCSCWISYFLWCLQCFAQVEAAAMTRGFCFNPWEAHVSLRGCPCSEGCNMFRSWAQVHVSVWVFTGEMHVHISQHYLGDRQHIPTPLFSSGAGELLGRVLVTSKAELPELPVGGTQEMTASCDTDWAAENCTPHFQL